MHHPARVERCRRQARPTNDVPPAPARSLPSRWGRRLAPTSRRRRISVAAAPKTTAAARSTSSADRSGLVNGRARWPQPMGDRSEGQALLTCSRSAAGVPSASPTPRSRYAAPTRPAAAPFALRPEGRNLGDDRGKAHKAGTDSTDGGPGPRGTGNFQPGRRRNPTATNTASSRFAAAPSRRVAARDAARGSGTEPRSSARPSSSSVRVCRTTRNVLISPARTAVNAKPWKNTTAPTPVPSGSPRRKRNAGFDAARVRIAACEGSSPNCVTTALEVAKPSRVIPRIQTGSVTRSLRAWNRASCSTPGITAPRCRCRHCSGAGTRTPATAVRR